MKATNYTVLTASHALRRIANVLYVVEALTARKRTAGREQVVADLDDLGDWDSQTVDTCRDLGIDVWHISDVAQDYVKNLVSAWTEHGIHGAERAELAYHCMFTGRKVGAIGIFYPITYEVEATSEEEARLACYDDFEHITEFSAERLR